MVAMDRLVVAANTEKLAVEIQHLISSTVIRCFTSTDVLGVEIGGALKNVYAIAAVS